MWHDNDNDDDDDDDDDDMFICIYFIQSGMPNDSMTLKGKNSPRV